MLVEVVIMEVIVVAVDKIRGSGFMRPSEVERGSSSINSSRK